MLPDPVIQVHRVSNDLFMKFWVKFINGVSANSADLGLPVTFPSFFHVRNPSVNVGDAQ